MLHPATRNALKSEYSAYQGRLATAEPALAAAKSGLEALTAQAAELRARLEAEKKRAAGLATERDNAEERLGAARRREEAARQKADSDRREAQERAWEAEGRVRRASPSILLILDLKKCISGRTAMLGMYVQDCMTAQESAEGSH